jgi:hypothetical protein
MKKTVLIILLGGMVTASALFAQDYEKTFSVFLAGLVNRNENLKTLAMPDVEIMTVPEIDSQALYIIDFKTPEDAGVFLSVLEKENIPYGTFPDNKLRVVLFYEDMIVFIFKTVIGLTQ